MKLSQEAVSLRRRLQVDEANLEADGDSSYVLLEKVDSKISEAVTELQKAGVHLMDSPEVDFVFKGNLTTNLFSKFFSFFNPFFIHLFNCSCP
jgi:hypothetical protein